MACLKWYIFKREKTNIKCESIYKINCEAKACDAHGGTLACNLSKNTHKIIRVIKSEIHTSLVDKRSRCGHYQCFCHYVKEGKFP